MCDLKLLGIEADPEVNELINGFCSCGCHVSTLKLEIKSLEALKAACQRLGLEWREGQQTYAWYGLFAGDSPLPEGFTAQDLGKSMHAIHVPGASYEIGVVFKDGAWRLLYDSWASGGLEAVLGKDCARLRHSYGVSAAVMEAQRQGYSCWEEQMTDGATKIHVMLPA